VQMGFFAEAGPVQIFVSNQVSLSLIIFKKWSLLSPCYISKRLLLLFLILNIDFFFLYCSCHWNARQVFNFESQNYVCHLFEVLTEYGCIIYSWSFKDEIWCMPFYILFLIEGYVQIWTRFMYK